MLSTCLEWATIVKWGRIIGDDGCILNKRRVKTVDANCDRAWVNVNELATSARVIIIAQVIILIEDLRPCKFESIACDHASYTFLTNRSNLKLDWR